MIFNVSKGCNTLQANLTTSQLNRSRTRFLLGWSLLVFLQSLIWFDWTNFGAGLLVITGGVLGTVAFFKRELLRAYPISTAMMLGFTTYYFLLPPLATLIEAKPLTNNLLHPILIFIHALLCLFFLWLAHKVYRSSNFFQSARRVISEKIYRPLGFFNVPNNEHLFAIGIVGLLAMATQVFFADIVQAEAMGAGNKFVQALFPLGYVPYCIVVVAIMGEARPLERRWFLALVIYTGVLFILSMSRNSRSALFMGVASIVIVYAYGIAIGVYSSRILRTRNILIGCLGIWLVSGPLADIAVSMQVVREQRVNISPVQLISETLSTFGNKEAINDYRMMEAISIGDWDETYVDNPFMSRLANLKFADNSLDLAAMFDKGTSEALRDLEWQKVLAVLPRPLLEFFSLDVDKDMVSSASGGDIMLFVATGSPYVLGGFRTGSLFGSGYGLFGWFYIPVLAALALLTFVLADAQTSRQMKPKSMASSNIAMSPMAIAAFFPLFFYFTSAASGVESMAALSQFILRGWIQVLLIYVIVYWGTYLLLKPFMNSTGIRYVNYRGHFYLALKRRSATSTKQADN